MAREHHHHPRRGPHVGEGSGDDAFLDPQWSDMPDDSGFDDPFASDDAADAFSDDPSNYYDVDTDEDSLGSSVLQGEIDSLTRQLQDQQALIDSLQYDDSSAYGDDGSDDGGGYGDSSYGSYGDPGYDDGSGDGSDGSYGPPIGGPVDDGSGDGGIGSPLPALPPVPPPAPPPPLQSSLTAIAPNFGPPAPLPIPHLVAPAPTFSVAPTSSLHALAANLLPPSIASTLASQGGIAPLLPNGGHPAPLPAPPPAPPAPRAAPIRAAVAPASSLHALASTFFGTPPPPAPVRVHFSGAAQLCGHDPLYAAGLVVAGARRGDPNAQAYVFRTAGLAARGSLAHVGAFNYLTRAALLADRQAWVNHYLYGGPSPLLRGAAHAAPRFVAGLGGQIPGIPGWGNPYGNSYLYGMGELS